MVPRMVKYFPGVDNTSPTLDVDRCLERFNFFASRGLTAAISSSSLSFTIGAATTCAGSSRTARGGRMAATVCFARLSHRCSRKPPRPNFLYSVLLMRARKISHFISRWSCIGKDNFLYPLLKWDRKATQIKVRLASCYLPTRWKFPASFECVWRISSWNKFGSTSSRSASFGNRVNYFLFATWMFCGVIYLK